MKWHDSNVSFSAFSHPGAQKNRAAILRFEEL